MRFFPDVEPLEHRYWLYPTRRQAIVVRFAPSPTGFLHIWHIYTALVNYLYSLQSPNSAFILRIEDTDSKRFVEWSIDQIISTLEVFWFTVTENMILWWNYGPYIQSQRTDIYASFAADLVNNDHAYLCFLSEQEIQDIRTQQEQRWLVPWIYAWYSPRRDASDEKIQAALASSIPYVIRRKSKRKNEKVTVNDIIKWECIVWARETDSVLIKADRMPVYHLAAMVDDILMWVTHVIRSDERFASVPLHQDLYDAWWKIPPARMHISPLMKIDDGKRRKLSKRHDPEANVYELLSQWFPPTWLIHFLCTIIDSRFEQRNIWKKSYTDFEFNFDAMSPSGAVVDMAKVYNICQHYFYELTSEEIYDQTIQWIDNHASDYQWFFDKKEYFVRVINIERDTIDPKRFSTYRDCLEHMKLFHDELYNRDHESNLNAIDAQEFSDEYGKHFDLSVSKEERFAQLKMVGKKLWYAETNAEYKTWTYKWKVWDCAMFLRIALFGSTKTPDLYESMCILWKQKVLDRLHTYVGKIS